MIHCLLLRDQAGEMGEAVGWQIGGIHKLVVDFYTN